MVSSPAVSTSASGPWPGRSGRFDPPGGCRVRPSPPREQVGPALGLLRRLDRLDEGEWGAELPEGAHPVGAVEDEVAVLVRRHDYGVSLLALRFHALSQSNQPVFVVGLVQDQAPEVHQSQVSEGGDHDERLRGSEKRGVSHLLAERLPPRRPHEKVEQDEPAEEEQRDDEEEPYDAHEQVECVQSSPFKRCHRAVQPQAVGTAGFEPATTRPPAECATRLRHVPTRL